LSGLKSLNNENKYKNISLNFGPQHPAAHGVLRLVLCMNNEVVLSCDPHIGLLHRGTEKLIENKNYIHSLPYFDRLDYVSTLVQESAFTNSVDRLCSVYSNSYSNLIRTSFDELTRLLNHLLAISCHALDVGSMSTILWSFEEREKIMEFYERFSGARMHTALYKPIIFSKNIKYLDIIDILNFISNCFITINELHNVLTFNKVWKKRLVNVGIIRHSDVSDFGLTGVMARSTGVKRDLRLDFYTNYNSYANIKFNSFYTNSGDSYDRYLLRIYEMIESLSIVSQSLLKLKNFYINKKLSRIGTNSMENTISLFKYWGFGFSVNSSIISSYIESPKGEFSITLLADGSERPYRCKIKSPSLQHLYFLKHITKGLFLADLVTLIGTIDIVFGEIDR